MIAGIHSFSVARSNLGGRITLDYLGVRYWCVFSPLKRLLLGRPLPTSAAQHERLSKITGLAVLSSDALSSVAYATDAMLEVLVPAGLIAISYTRPLAFLIAGLLIIVTFSYRQTIHAYPRDDSSLSPLQNGISECATSKMGARGNKFYRFIP